MSFCPTGLSCARALVGTEGTARSSPSEGAADHSPVSLAGGCSDTTTPHRRRSCSGDSRVSIPSASKGWKAASLMACAARKRPTRNCCLRARISSGGFGADDAASADAQAQKLIAKLRQFTRPADVRVYSGPQSSLCGRYANPVRGRPPLAPGAPAEWEGWDDAAGLPQNWAVSARHSQAHGMSPSYCGSFYGTLRDGCIHMRDFVLRGGRHSQLCAFIDRAVDR